MSGEARGIVKGEKRKEVGEEVVWGNKWSSVMKRRRIVDGSFVVKKKWADEKRTSSVAW